MLERKKTKEKAVRIMAVLLALIALVSLSACGGKKAKTAYESFKWPDSDIAKSLPVPKSTIGEIVTDTAKSLWIEVAETTKEQYEEYIEECKKSGYTENYNKVKDYYYADNKTGYHLSLNYDDGNIMKVNAKVIESDEKTATSKTEEQKPTEKATEQPEEKSDDSNSSDNTEVTPSFKETMDSYEEFMNEYVDFMKKYSESDNALDMLSEYSDMMKKYSEYMTKIDDIDTGNLSTADLAYYLEVTARVAEKLATLSQ